MNDPADGLLRISMSHGLPRCLHAVAELGIADALGESPRSAEELARDTGTDAGALARTLRVLSAEGILRLVMERGATRPHRVCCNRIIRNR